MKFGIYIWHVASNPNKFCIGEWNPDKKSYKGLSVADSAEKRILQEFKKGAINDLIIDSAEIYDFKDFEKNSHADSEVHKLLKRYFGNSVNTEGEWFKLSKSYKNPVEIFKAAIYAAANKTMFNPERPNYYGLREGSQDVAVKEILAAYKNGYKKALLGAKCRFGKTFTSYMIMKTGEFKSTLILTFRPSDTKDAWRNDLNSHIEFSDYQYFSQDNQKEFDEFTGNKVLFISYQKLGKDVNSFLAKYKNVFDLIIIDEDQVGAHKKENREVAESLNPNFLLVNTGTPELEIISNEFDVIYTWDYIDEQEAKENNVGNGAYKDMPKLSMYSFDLEAKFANSITSDKNGFSLSEFFAVEKDKGFKHYSEVVKFIDYLYYDYNDPSEEMDENFAVFASARFAGKLKHGLWKLPSIDACYELEKIFIAKRKDVECFVIPENDNLAKKNKEELCHEAEARGHSTVWLTVVKNTVGVTVKPWTYTMSLFGTDSSSMTSYIQFIFRAGSPDKNKDEIFSFDFCPSRILAVADNMAQARANRKNKSYDQEITEVLNYLPVFAYNGSSGFAQLGSSDFFKEISKYTTVEATKALVKDSLKEGFAEEKDILTDFDVDKFNPVVTSNKELSKLLKEAKAKKENSSKKEAEAKKEKDDFVEIAFQIFLEVYKFIIYTENKVEDVDDFIDKIKQYSYNYEAVLGFSKEIMQLLIAVIVSDKKNFGIALQRFSHLQFKCNVSDVPEELAKRMVSKLELD